MLHKFCPQLETGELSPYGYWNVSYFHRVYVNNPLLICFPPYIKRASLLDPWVKNPPAMKETQA